MKNQPVLNQSAQRVQDALLKKGLPFEVKQLSKSTRTANEAATAIGCDIAQIVKSLLFCTLKNNKPILILASGKNRVNQKTIEALVGEEIIKADADFTREITGFAIGGIPPLENEKIRDVFIDQNLFNFETLWAAAGTPFAVFSLYSCDIQKVVQGKIISIK